MARYAMFGRPGIEAAEQQWTLSAHVQIRGTRAEDLAKLEWFGAYAHFRDLFNRTWRDHQAGRRLMLVADLRTFPIGQVWLDVTPRDYAYLYGLRVMEPMQGLGIGTRLINSAEALARSHGYHQIQLAVERANVGALRLYQRLGFATFNQRVDIWSYVDQYGETQWVQEDVYGMQKSI